MFEVSRNQHLTRVDKWHFHVSLLRRSKILAASHRSSQESEQSDQSDHVWATNSIKHIKEATRKPCITDCRSNPNPGSFFRANVFTSPIFDASICMLATPRICITHCMFLATTILVGKTGQFLLLPCQFLPKLGFLPYFCPIFFGSNHTSAVVVLRPPQGPVGSTRHRGNRSLHPPVRQRESAHRHRKFTRWLWVKIRYPKIMDG